MSAQRRDPGGLPARRAPPLAPRLRRHPCPLLCSPIKPSAPVSSLHTRGTRGPAISATFNPPPWDAQFQLTAQNDRSRARWAGRGPSPDLTGMVGLDWAPKPVRPGRGGRMAEEGGEQGTAWARGRDGPHSSAPPQVAGPPRPPSPTGPTRGRALLGEVWRSGGGGSQATEQSSSLGRPGPPSPALLRLAAGGKRLTHPDCRLRENPGPLPAGQSPGAGAWP